MFSYMESDVRAKSVMPALEKIKSTFAKGGETHTQNFVYDEL